MVCINTHYPIIRQSIRFTHFVNIPSSHCTIATAREEHSNRARVFLITNERQVYFRSPLNDTWLEERRQSVYQLIETTLNDQRIPHYSTLN